MSIRYKLLLAFSMVVVLAAGVATYGSRVVSRTSEATVQLYDGPLMAVNHVRSAQLQFARARLAFETLLTRDSLDAKSALARFDSAKNQFLADIKIVRNSPAGI